MQTINNNDLFFDDLTMITLLNSTTGSITNPNMYNDCTNNFNDCTDNGVEREKSNQLKIDGNHSSN